MDLLFPVPVRVSTITPAPLSNTASGRSIFSGALRTLGRAGDRFGFDITVSAANDREVFPMRAALRNIRSGLRGQANRLWFADPSYKLSGSFPTGELVVNGTFVQGAAGWSTSAASLAVAGGYARVQNSGAAPGLAGNAAAISIVNGASYVARAFSYPGNQPDWNFIGGTAAFGSTYFTAGLQTTTGLLAMPFTAGGTTLFIAVSCSTSVAADFIHFLWLSVSRCALVNGASQTGTVLRIQALPASVNGLLLPGDRVQIGTQLNTVAAPLNSDGSGLGYLQCHLPWRVSPANGAAVIIDKPMARCALTNITDGWDESPGGFADFEFQIEESLDA